MKKPGIILVAAIAVSGAVMSALIQHRSRVESRAGEAMLRARRDQFDALSVEHARLSNLVARADGGLADGSASELAQLRREVGALEKRTNDLAANAAKSRAARPVSKAANNETHPPEFWKRLHEMAGGKPADVLHLASAFLLYAWDHQNQSPTSLDQLPDYLAKQNWQVTGTNQFEIVYQGSLDRLHGISPQIVAVLREQQQWPGPDGRMRRVYGMADGTSEIVDSDDNFQSWETEHIVPPP